MPREAPHFWFRRGHWAGLALAPLGWLYDAGVRLRFAFTAPYRSCLPIVCIGNFTLGGAGKTPFAIEVAALLRAMGRRPVFLTRGFGGRERGPHLVDGVNDSAERVGDEPLLLARHAPVVVSADRPAGARFIERLAADVIIMDDGFQNPTLAKDLSLIVVDAVRGIGNGLVFPAGPLRASLSFQLPRADALVLSGAAEQRSPGLGRMAGRFRGKVLRTRIEPEGDISWLQGARVAAVAGIAHPAKFHATLTRLGASIAVMHDFPDHHPFSEAEAAEIMATAAREGTPVVMTEKDWVRLPSDGKRGRLKREAKVLRIRVAIEEPERLRALLARLPLPAG
jgi:tetraacyldisaccharide 4'-kinase